MFIGRPCATGGVEPITEKEWCEWSRVEKARGHE
jgi:hypothetical protein